MNVTKYFDSYREAYRHVWNTYFIGDRIPTAEDHEIFELIDLGLFQRIVMTQIDPLGILNKESIIQGIRLIGRTNGFPLMINRTGNGGYWDHAVNALMHDEYEIKFISYFDWDDIGFKDGRYIMVEIIKSKLYPQIVGHRALIESQYLEIFYLKAVKQGNVPESALPVW